MIRITNLLFKYGRKGLFSDLNLTLSPGGICGLLGKNGAGKTTLLKLMAGLRFPGSGEIEIYGRLPSGREVGFLQDTFFLPEAFDLPPVTPQRYAELYSVFYPGFQKERFREYLQGFEVREDKKLNGVSYGQKKKFLIAFGLATRCRLMLLDEPTNGLEVSSKSSFRKAVASSMSDDQIFVIATHQIRDLENLMDPVVILDRGRVIFNHSMEAVSNRLKIAYQIGAPDPEEVLYFERRMGGYAVVSENRDNELTHIDLEILFSSILGENGNRVTGIFQEDR
jgi:ABC-2 type transport system ATP-binding protein